MSDNLIIKNNVIIGFDDEFVEEIVIPEGTTKIANGALKKFYGLKSIVFPQSLTAIGESAFEKCSSLESIVLPESLTTIGECAFKECVNLRKADLSKTQIKQIPYECFSECKKLSSIVFPSTALKVGNRCFTGCKNLVDIQFNEGLRVIEDSLYDCTTLSTLYIPSTLIHMEDVSYRRNIQTVKTTSEQYERFRELLPSKCTLDKITLVNGAIVDFSEYDDFEIEGTDLIEYIGDDDNVVIPKGITQINSYAFADCQIKTISFPQTLKRICYSAFRNCAELKEIVLNEGLIEIESSAFEGCKVLDAISLPSTLQYLCEGAFSGCHKVKNVNCINNLQYSFIEGCLIEGNHIIIESFGNRIPENNSIDDIAEGAFDGYGYMSVTIPSNIKHISSSAFTNCKSMESLCIKHDVEIESYAFTCDNLTQLVLSSDCTHIDEGAIQVPHNNMLNIFVEGNTVPESLEYCVNFIRYNHYCGELIDPYQKSGTHHLWAPDEWDKTSMVSCPKNNLLCHGNGYDAYFIGYGFTILESIMEISIGFIDSRPIWDRVNNEMKARKIRLSKVEINGIDYLYDIHDFYGDTLCQNIYDFAPVVFGLDSDKISNAIKYSDRVSLCFDIYDENDTFIDGFAFDVLIN